MKKLIAAILAVSIFCMNGCTPDDSPEQKTLPAGDSSIIVTEQKTVTPDSVAKKVEATTATIVQSTEYKATKEMCACVNASLKDISPRVQQIFIRAGNSERPLQVLQNEIVTISDKEQEELFVQLQRFASDPKLQNCSEDIRKKYGIDAEDLAAQEKILAAAKNNKDCELVYALLRISLQQQAAAAGEN